MKKEGHRMMYFGLQTEKVHVPLLEAERVVDMVAN
jgi:hypothetical protein